MKLSCVTAVFNAIKSGNRERLIRCVESVASLKTEHEHLIYDGASTDGSVALLRELEKKTPGLRVVSEKDAGIYNALNKGIRDAEGEWLYVLGCDDFVCAPIVMDEMIANLGDDCDVLATSVRIVHQDGTLLTIMSPSLSEIYHKPCACHQGEIMRTSVARELHGFDEQYRIAADSDMFLRAHLANYRFKYLTDYFTVFMAGGASGACYDSSLEHRVSVANVLKLTGKDRDLMVNRKVLPLRVCVQLWNHPDLVIRQATRAMIPYRIKATALRILNPLIVGTRPFRHWLFNYQ